MAVVFPLQPRDGRPRQLANALRRQSSPGRHALHERRVEGEPDPRVVSDLFDGSPPRFVRSGGVEPGGELFVARSETEARTRAEAAGYRGPLTRDQIAMIKLFPKAAHPMDTIRTAVSYLGTREVAWGGEPAMQANIDAPTL